MASVSEKSPGDGTLILTVEDVNHYMKPGDPEPRFQVVVRVLRSADGGNNWSYVNTLQLPRGFNNLGPYHIRSKVTGDLILICRTDRPRMNDPAYDPHLALKKGLENSDPRWNLTNLDVFRSGDDGVTWQFLEQGPRSPYRPGDGEISVEPGVTELPFSPTSSNLIFQWTQLLGGLDPAATDRTSKSWVQTLTIRK